MRLPRLRVRIWWVMVVILLTSFVLAGLAAHRERQRRLLSLTPFEWSYQDAKLTREVAEIALDIYLKEEPEPKTEIAQALASDSGRARAEERAKKATLDRMEALDSKYERGCRVAAFWTLFLVLAIVFTLIAVHEAGHFLAGMVAGIPAHDMRIVLLAFPQHVALRDGDRWVSPIRDIERFITVSRHHLASRGAAFLWVAGGMVFELIVTALACLASISVGWRGVAFWVACLSLSMYLICLRRKSAQIVSRNANQRRNRAFTLPDPLVIPSTGRLITVK